MTKYLLIAASLSAAAPAAPAQAGPPPPAPTVTVRYGDLDLGSEAGRRTLQGRLDAAVRSVCPHGSAGGPDETLARQRCIRAAAAVARRQAGVAMVRANQARLADAVLAAR